MDWPEVDEAKTSKRLLRGNRRVVRLEEFTDQEIEMIAAAAVKSGHEDLDAELQDWKP